MFIVYFCGWFSWFWFCYLSTSHEIGYEEHLQNDLFSVEWDAEPWPVTINHLK